MPLKFLETANPSAVSKSCDYFSRKQKSYVNQRVLFISMHQYQARLCLHLTR